MSGRAKVTKTICGRKIALRKGVAYVACLPLDFLGPKFRSKPVTISIMRRDDVFGPIAEMELGNFTQESAKEFLAEFNNGRTSFVGRAWTSK